jgi:pyridoxine 5'-phosphate synthase PdxJ
LRNVELAIRKAYKTAIDAANTGAFFSFGEALQNNNYGEAIVMKSIDTNEITNKALSHVDARVTLVITTNNTTSNNGLNCAQIADKVIEAIYQNQRSKLDLSEFNLQCYNSNLISQKTDSWSVQNQVVYVDTTLVFSHKIFINTI